MKSILELTENEVIHVTNREDNDKLMQIFDSIGLKWMNGKSYLYTSVFDDYKEDTCYSPKKGGYSRIDYHKEEKHTIYTVNQIKEMQDVETIETLTEKLKVLAESQGIVATVVLEEKPIEEGTWCVFWSSDINTTINRKYGEKSKDLHVDCSGIKWINAKPLPEEFIKFIENL